MRWFFALLLLTGVAVAQSHPQPSPSQQPSSQPTQQTAPDQRGTEQLPLSVKIVPAIDADKKSANEDSDRKDKAIIDRKLAYETQRIADYTLYLAVFTALVFVVSGIVGYAAFTTASAAKLSAEAVIDAERPHMIMDELVVSGLNSPDVNGGKNLRFSYQIRNFGRTPSFAKEMALQFYFGSELPEGQTFGGKTEIIGVTAPDLRYGVQWPNEIFIPADKIQPVIARVSNIFFLGFFKYTDVFERPHETHFAYRFEFDAGADSSKHFAATEPKSYWKYT
jgi:hypothetical protein